MDGGRINAEWRRRRESRSKQPPTLRDSPRLRVSIQQLGCLKPCLNLWNETLTVWGQIQSGGITIPGLEFLWSIEPSDPFEDLLKDIMDRILTPPVQPPLASEPPPDPAEPGPNPPLAP